MLLEKTLVPKMVADLKPGDVVNERGTVRTVRFFRERIARLDEFATHDPKEALTAREKRVTEGLGFMGKVEREGQLKVVEERVYVEGVISHIAVLYGERGFGKELTINYTPCLDDCVMVVCYTEAGMILAGK